MTETDHLADTCDWQCDCDAEPVLHDGAYIVSLDGWSQQALCQAAWAAESAERIARGETLPTVWDIEAGEQVRP